MVLASSTSAYGLRGQPSVAKTLHVSVYPGPRDIKLRTIHSLTRPHVDYHYHICFQLALQKGLNIRKNEIIEDISWLYFWAKYLYIFQKGQRNTERECLKTYMS